MFLNVVDVGQSRGGDGGSNGGGMAESHEEGPLPTVFRNAIHLAIQYNSVDALMLLLVSGVDPNRPGSGGSATDHPQDVLSPDKTASSSSSAAAAARERHKVSFVEGPKTPTDDVFLRPQTPVENSLSTGGRKIADATVLRSSAALPPKANLRRIKSLRHDRCSAYAGPGDAQPKRERREQVAAAVVDYSDVDNLFDLPPLFFAVTQRNQTAIDLLLRYGASPAAVDDRGCSPLHLLSSGEQFQSATCAAALIEYGAKVHQTNDDGVAPSHLTPELVVRQTQLLRDKLQVLASTALQAAATANGGDNGKQQQHITSSDHSRFGSRLFRRSHRKRTDESLGHRSRPSSSGAGARDCGGKGSETRDSLDKDDSLFNHVRSGSVGSSKSRASNGPRAAAAVAAGPSSVSPALSGRSDEAPLESLASVNSAVEKASKVQG